MREETTIQMEREELLGLLDATAGTAQRVTAEMKAVPEPDNEFEDEELLQPFSEDQPNDPTEGFVIRFKVKPQPRPARYFVIAASFVASLAAGIGLAAAIM